MKLTKARLLLLLSPVNQQRHNAMTRYDSYTDVVFNDLDLKARHLP